MVDICMATIMGFDIKKISLLKAAFFNVQHQNIDVTLNAIKINLSDLSTISIRTDPPRGWIDYLSKK